MTSRTTSDAPPCTLAPLDAVLEAIASAPDAVVLVDATGIVRYWNGGAERIFGFRADEMVGATLDRIIPERLRERHNRGFRVAMDRGTTRYGDSDLLAVPATTADGRTISVEFSVSLLQGGGHVTHVAAIMRDVTARWSRERETRRRLEALEALEERLPTTENPDG